MSVVIRLKVPNEMHYTVIPMSTSKVNSSRRNACILNLLFWGWAQTDHQHNLLKVIFICKVQKVAMRMHVHAQNAQKMHSSE